MASMLGGCSASGSREPLRVRLPPAPEYAEPIDVRNPRKGETLIGIAARERAGRIAANGRITAFRDWYEGVREDYAR